MDNYKNLKSKYTKFFSLVLLFTFIFSTLFSNVTFSLENNSSNFNNELKKYEKYLEINKEPISLSKGDNTYLYKYVVSTKEDAKKLVWLSSNEDIVSVDSLGKITSLEYGKAKIYAIDDSTKYVFEIYVEEVGNESVSVKSYSGDEEENENIENKNSGLELNDEPLEKVKGGFSEFEEKIKSLDLNAPQSYIVNNANFKDKEYKVFIDPGHGGSDPGAIGLNKLTEKEVTLAVGMKVKSKLEAQGIKVQISRTTDVFVDLSPRAQMANIFGADAFVSIHNNSFGDRSVSGTETYVYTGTGERINESKKLAGLVQNNLLNNLGSKNRGVKSADFAVVRQTYMPAILAELEFISNPTVEEKMRTDKFREDCANAIVAGVLSYLKDSSGTVTPPGGEAVTGVTLNKDTVYLKKDDTVAIQAQVAPQNAGNKQVTWTSSHPYVAVVDAYGNIIGKSAGTTTITATTKDGGFKASATVHVKGNVVGERIFGSNRYLTSYEASKKGWQNSDYAVIASGVDYPDALCAGPLAKKYNAPILLSEQKSLTEGLKNELQRLKVKQVFIVGGEGALSKDIENQIKALGINIKRIGGANRYETSVLIAKEVGNSGKMVFATGLDYPDALSIAPIAANLSMPIVLVGKNNIDRVVKEYVDSQNIQQSYVVGAEGVISKQVASNLPAVKRLGGNNRYDTNKAIINEFKSTINFSNVYVATGMDYPDALSGSALAAKGGHPIILTHPREATARGIIESNLWSINKAYVFGSSALIPNDILDISYITVK
ncbi:N-acetylmuramoyl-L-alanine amidase family protein [Clostridium argentinense CDC 2741]|uniref:N-acetylmuramoyl-L-alanine amidase family protein n=1 Tax=Clostridium argentinense CDC 2741 TaxID=1418104 RepID=A0A0C1U9A1_9CLOT|nr:cell wall-binding repeat-containing protein [Clostridium argentinense]KIE48273.1 N-acetylmuramoyl-L-alanine amidase family protein [Clostridium argentinense CDC 2741]